MVRTVLIPTLALVGFALIGTEPGGGALDPPVAVQADQAEPQVEREGGTTPSVTAIRVEEPVTPTTNDYIRRALDEAAARGSNALLIELDTPGGLLESTRGIVQAFYESEVPVVVYVSPGGARAASAGTFITMAAHVAAMAPSTTIGAASPVSMGGGGEAQMDTVSQNKAFNYAESLIASIAERRGRNVDWAISAVREAEAVTESEALDLNVIDLVAEDRDELLEAIDGRVVDGDTLRTAGAAVEELPKTMAERFLGFITRPELMLILSMVAIYGIIGEVSNPGAIVPGVTGVIALILLLYASAAMPVNLVGYLLLALAVVLFVSEAFTPAFGVLIAGGAVSFFMGALILFQDLPDSLALSWAWLVPATVITTLFFVWIVTQGIRIQLAPARTGLDSMTGQVARVVDPVGPDGGRVFVSGEYWSAVSDEEIPADASCVVESIDGLTMRVRKSGGVAERPTSPPSSEATAS